MLDLPKTKVKVFVANIGDSVNSESVKIARMLREKGISCQTDLMGRGLGKQLEYADSMGIPFVIVVGEKEVNSGIFKVKDMKNKKETEVRIDQAIGMLSSNG